MKSSSLYAGCLIACLLLHFCVFSQHTVTYYGQTFKIDTLYPAMGTTGMNTPWEMVYGPDDSLWVTAAHDYKVWKIHPGNRGARMVRDFSCDKDFTNPAAWPQGGLMGLAIHPQFFSGKPWVYIAYVYHLVSCGTLSGSSFCSYNTKISRYQYVSGSLVYMDDVITGLNGSNDHNSGRIRINPLPEADGNYHLYYTIGDMGAGNLANANRPNHAQDTTIIEGKILRLNTEPDATQPSAKQWIPKDNPFPAGAAASAKTAIYSYGHRNPQGLDFGSVNGGASYILYSAEHGDKSDDEVNIILPHVNYGWPKVAGLCDDNYTSTTGDSMYLASKSVISETGFCHTTTTTLADPIFSFYNWGRAANKAAQGLANSYWPTIAPAAITFYGRTAIPGWNYSLLIPSLKNGLFRLKLKADGLSVDSMTLPTDTLHYLPGLRLRNITVAPSGDTLFVSVDNSCCAIDSSGTMGTSVANPPYKGYILRMIYLTTLGLSPGGAPVGSVPSTGPAVVRVYPNPVQRTLHVEAGAGQRKPLLASLYDMTGQLLLARQTSDDSFTIDVHSFSPGTYVLRLVNGYAVPLVTEKIVIR